MDKTKATLCVLAAGALWGCISLFVRALDAAGLNAFEISSIRMAVGVLGMFFIILVRNPNLLQIHVRDLWLFVGTGVVSVTLFNVCYFMCINLSEASIAVVLLYTSPIWVMLMSALFFKERITGRKVIALGLTFGGCVLVAGILGGAVRLTPIALALGLASGFFYATYSIFGRKALERYDTLTITFYTFLLGLIASCVMGDPIHTVATAAANPALIAPYLGIGIFCTIVPYMLYTTGLKHLETSRAAILATIEPLVGSLLGIFVYGESTGLLKLLGMACILAAVVLVNTGGKNEAERP
ncbi:MAG: EamA family transporter [Coriobacteriia bacterium]|nr:EamA family transporter [Coriobacteriia bacterium]